ncbi:Cactin [Thelohanellus kitauei]|uniref:Splicing factor Cactin n=1 Tax=Thelohanellus kitauei TaxID=669202 RepID=A0A0C2MRT4_THEKT|nr:Cactin [Thelohanellus kitauei]
MEDIRVYQKLEGGKNDDFWEDSKLIVTEIIKTKTEQADSESHFKVSKVEDLTEDILKIFLNKTYEELANLKSTIITRIKGSHDIDVDYWNTVLKLLTVKMAEKRIHSICEELIAYREKVKLTTPPSPPTAPVIEDIIPEPSTVTEDNPLKEFYDAYQEGGYSPILAPVNRPANIITPEEDSRLLILQREFIHDIREKERTVLKSKNLKTARKQMYDDHDEEFSEVYAPPDKKTSTDLKLPRFYNKIHTGYEWHKLTTNQYDAENPPPKIITGYKFNIFYPDLQEKVRRPQYSVAECKEDPESSILTISSGPPYDNISFKILNKEWNFNSREGFTCQFAKNTFQLWFYFKKTIL